MSRIGWDASRMSAAALVACLAGGALAVAGVVAPAHADVGPVNPVTVDLDGHAANSGFTVVVRGDVHLAADESEGTIALGGDLSFGTTYNIGTAATPTFTVPGETNPVHLFVGGGIDWASTGSGQILRVLNQGFTKIGDPSTFAAFNKNPNDYQITAPGGAIDQTPRIEGVAAQSPASIAAPVPAGLIDIEGAFALYEQLSTDLATCPATVVLTDDQGAPVTSPPSAPFRGHVRLQPDQTNVLSISADDLATLQELQFDDVPTQTSPLLINVAGDFSGAIPNSPGISGAAAHFILYNFADATTVTVTGGDSLHGTVYAPRAVVDWRRTNNLEGNLIAASAIHGGPAVPVGFPREFHNRPFDAELACATSAPESTLTLLKLVQGGSAVPTDWTLSAVDGSTVITGVSGSPEVTGTVTDPGDYVLSESGGPAGYEPGPWSCTGATAMNGDVVTLDAGQDAVCTVTNVFTGTTPTLPPDPAPGPPGAGLAASGTDSTPVMLIAACAIGLGLWFRIGARRRQSR
ncbi:choice-of-anchor A family protein [Agromyces fucosus]|uniref:Choice-of-anchor A family protein n=2 Tax=Agromyces fucosus TaxID=41985 RepID=A0A4Q2JL53_9MICO|nr:choice-of-anchor A family protein [Agromyces fucosus]